MNLKAFAWNGSEGPFAHSLDLRGDGRLTMIEIRDHSAGQCALRIRADDGRFVLLVADGGYGRASWEEQILIGIALNRADQKKSQQWIRLQAEDPGCVAVLATHDREVGPGTLIL